MLHALILVCNILAVPDASNCDMTSAIRYEHAPEGALLPLQCFQYGEAWYASEIEPVRPTLPGEYHRVVCSHSSFRGRVG